MSMLITDDGKELILTCECGCDEAIHLIVDDEDKRYDAYAIIAFMNGNFYKEQDDSLVGCLKRKARKIWAIIRNKDYCYSDIHMNRKDFERFKEYINQF